MKVAIAAMMVVAANSGCAILANEPRAVIIDQLAVTDPNPEFVARATQLLRAHGYDVDYVGARDVRLDLYQNLPRRGYRLIIVRSHASQIERVGSPTSRDVRRAVSVFTNEPYSATARVAEQRKHQVDVGSFRADPSQNVVFSINAKYVTEVMRGRFQGATFVLMGCGGLNSTGFADAMLERGVERFVSWDGSVTAAHNDQASELLLSRFLEHGDMRIAVERTNDEAGSDPAFGSVLEVLP